MTRPIVVLASTFLFAAFGLLVGWLTTQARVASDLGERASTDLLLFCFGFAPSIGAVTGFVLSVLALKLFADSQPKV